MRRYAKLFPAILALAICSDFSGSTAKAASLIANAAHASSSPDGKQMVFQRKTSGGWRLFVSNVDGSNAHAITQGPGNDIEPDWRADGKLIAFVSNRAGAYNIYVCDPSGVGLRRVTHTSANEHNPRWSPLLFQMDDEKDPLAKKHPGRPTTGSTPSDLKVLQWVADQDSMAGVDSGQFDSYTSAQYYKLLFVTGSTRQIGTVREDGRYLFTFPSGEGPVDDICWSPDANQVAFAARGAAGDKVYVSTYPVTHDFNENGGPGYLFKPRLDDFHHDMKRFASSLPADARVAFTLSQEYVAVAAGGKVQLLPVDKKLPAMSALSPARCAPEGFGWMGDGRTALVTVDDADGWALAKVRLNEPLMDVAQLSDWAIDIRPGRALLAKNGFAVGGEQRAQMFDIYESADYADQPTYITTDSLLQVNHEIFDYLLRSVEEGSQFPATIDLVNHYLAASLEQMKSSNPEVSEAARRNAAFFTVAGRLTLGAVSTGLVSEAPPADDPLAEDRSAYVKQDIADTNETLAGWAKPLKATLARTPRSVNTLADKEIALIKAHGGAGGSPIFGATIDYSDFVPRGYYTRTELLRRYFLVYHWLRSAPFAHNNASTRQALLILSATDPSTRAKWSKVQDFNRRFVGRPDDQDMDDYLKIAKGIYGGTPTQHEVADGAKLAVFIAQIDRLPGPHIAPLAGPAFYFLPAPYTFDSEVYQMMVYNGNLPGVGTAQTPRYFAMGLDVMASLSPGVNNRAHTILSRTRFNGDFFNFGLNETQYPNYDRQYQVSRKFVAGMTPSDWRDNLYTRDLYAILPLLGKVSRPGEPYTQSAAWADRCLNTALGTWAELKHDTLPKSPTVAEAGDEEGISESPVKQQPVGYIERAPAVYGALENLAQAEEQTLQETGYLTPDFKQRIETYAALLAMVRRLEAKEEAGAPFTLSEIEQIRFFGIFLEHLSLLADNGETSLLSESNMGIIADVASATSVKLGEELVLEEGVGGAAPLYVAVPFNGHRELAVGADFSYYEFTHPASDRLSDDGWHAVLHRDHLPASPAWTNSFQFAFEPAPEGNEDESGD